MIKPGKKLTIKDIAQLAGVSIGTVDRVIHNRGEVSEKTREKIQKITNALNYQPDVLASTLASKKNVKFALLMPYADAESSFWKAPNTGIVRALDELEHFGLLISIHLFSLTDKYSFLSEANKALNENPDVVLIAPSFQKEAAEVAQKCTERQIPFVFFNSNLPNLNQLCFVGQDALQSGIVAAKLMDYGLKENSEILIVSLLSLLKNNNHILNRKQGFIQYFETNQEKNCNLHSLDIDSLDVGDVYNALRDSFKEYPSINGIFVTNSRVFHVARFLESEKINNVNLIGFDLTEENIPYLEKGIIKFLINQKPIEQAYRAIITAFNKIVLKKEVSEEILLPIEIVTKENLMYYE